MPLMMQVASCLGMVETIYERFGMPVTYALSTRPDEVYINIYIYMVLYVSVGICHTAPKGLTILIALTF